MSNLGEDFVDFTAEVLYRIESRLISMDKAFRDVRLRRGLRAPLKPYYDAVSDVVRNYRYLSFLARQMLGSASRKAAAKAWILLHGNSHYSRRLGKRARATVEDAETKLMEIRDRDRLLYLSIKYSYPEWLVKELSLHMDIGELERMLEALNRRVIWLRINTLKTDLDKAVKILEDLGVEYVQHREYPFMLRVIRYRRPITRSRLFKEGIIVPQDLASVMVVASLDPRPGDLILDACAAPGMKTSLIMQLTENGAEVVAVDVSRDRLLKMRRLLKVMGVDESRIHLALADSRKLKAMGEFDDVLVDAPCTSSGASSKDPGVKLILDKHPDLPERYSRLQHDILVNIVSSVKFSRMTYATCSILPQEGEMVVEEVTSKYPLKLVKPPIQGLSSGYRGFTISSLVSRTMPHINESEGFFISNLVPG